MSQISQTLSACQLPVGETENLEVDLEAAMVRLTMYAKREFSIEAKRSFLRASSERNYFLDQYYKRIGSCNCPKDARSLWSCFMIRKTRGVQPDRVILTSVLSACAFDYGRSSGIFRLGLLLLTCMQNVAALMLQCRPSMECPLRISFYGMLG